MYTQSDYEALEAQVRELTERNNELLESISKAERLAEGVRAHAEEYVKEAEATVTEQKRRLETLTEELNEREHLIESLKEDRARILVKLDRREEAIWNAIEEATKQMVDLDPDEDVYEALEGVVGIIAPAKQWILQKIAKGVKLTEKDKELITELIVVAGAEEGNES